MYNLNYTYLTELEVDTRQTFADLCDDLLLVNLMKEPEPGTLKPKSEGNVLSMRNVISAWQEYFWDTNVSEKRDLNITFTDISIEHGTNAKSGKDYNGDPLKVDEMMSYSELSSFFKEMDGDGRPGQGKWCGKWTLTELCCNLLNAIDTLHDRLLNQNNIYPIGSMFISKNSPSGFGKWTNQKQSYLSERIAEISGFKIGFNDGKVMNKVVGTDLDSIVIKADTTTVPMHEHSIEFVPPSASNSGSSSGDATTKGSFATVEKLKTGKNGPPGSMSGTWSGENQDKIEALVVKGDASSTLETNKKERDASGSLSALQTEVTSIGQNGVNVAPKSYPINSYVWERTS